jgi:hypothetical protein
MNSLFEFEVQFANEYQKGLIFRIKNYALNIFAYLSFSIASFLRYVSSKPRQLAITLIPLETSDAYQNLEKPNLYVNAKLPHQCAQIIFQPGLENAATPLSSTGRLSTPVSIEFLRKGDSKILSEIDNDDVLQHPGIHLSQGLEDVDDLAMEFNEIQLKTDNINRGSSLISFNHISNDLILNTSQPLLTGTILSDHSNINCDYLGEENSCYSALCSYIGVLILASKLDDVVLNWSMKDRAITMVKKFFSDIKRTAISYCLNSISRSDAMLSPGQWYRSSTLAESFTSLDFNTEACLEFIENVEKRNLSFRRLIDNLFISPVDGGRPFALLSNQGGRSLAFLGVDSNRALLFDPFSSYIILCDEREVVHTAKSKLFPHIFGMGGKNSSFNRVGKPFALPEVSDISLTIFYQAIKTVECE